jgi:hypothetical protein
MPFVKRTIFLMLCTAVFAAAEEPPAGENEGIDLPIPVGIPMNGLKIPHYDDEGKQDMLMESDVATKIDDETIEFQNLRIEALDDEGRKIFVELPHSVFNLESRILSGNQSARIHREDFEIKGDSIEFDTRTKFGRMRGQVTMIISSANTDK